MGLLLRESREQSQGPLTAEGPRTVHADYDGSHGDPNADLSDGEPVLRALPTPRRAREAGGEEAHLNNFNL